MRRALARPPGPSDRKAMLAKLHVAKKQLALTDDSYRDLLRRITGADSAARLDVQQLDRMLAEFRRLGWKGTDGKRPAPAKAQVRMILAVWRDMAPLLSDASESGLRAFVRRQTRGPLHPDGVAAPEFLDAQQANRVLEGLKGWRARLARTAAQADGGHAA